jgi:succinate-semialdehyde dehydrogenase/glutarate-semialdehyde dehydrogenase
MPFDTEEEAIALANDCEYALTAAVFTADPVRARRLEERIEAGALTVNDACFTFSDARAPWGGPKNSGLGRTHGAEGLAELVEVKYVSEDWSRRDRQLWWHPYGAAKLAMFKTAFNGMYADSLTTRVVSLMMLLPAFPMLAREANLPLILTRVPAMLME